MRKASVFFFWMLLLTISVFVIDWLRANYSVYGNHSIFIIFKTLFFPIAGIILMKFSVTPKCFKLFLIVYLSLWASFFLLKFIFFAGAGLHLITVSRDVWYKNSLLYLDYIKLSTPIPFIFFWMVDRIFFVEQKKQS